MPAPSVNIEDPRMVRAHRNYDEIFGTCVVDQNVLEAHRQYHVRGSNTAAGLEILESEEHQASL